jgi:hypothetical protein
MTESSRGGEFDQHTLYACMEIDNETFEQLIHANF